MVVVVSQLGGEVEQGSKGLLRHLYFSSKSITIAFQQYSNLLMTVLCFCDLMCVHYFFLIHFCIMGYR